MSDDDDKVIELHPEGEEANKVVRVKFSPVGILPDTTEWCSHSQSIINKQMRWVKCKACGAVLDPIDVLYRLSLHAQSFVNMREKRRLLEEEIKELKREEKRIKDRIRTAKRSSNDG